jgi:hypothetical protein
VQSSIVRAHERSKAYKGKLIIHKALAPYNITVKSENGHFIDYQFNNIHGPICKKFCNFSQFVKKSCLLLELLRIQT